MSGKTGRKTFKCLVAFDGRGRINCVLFDSRMTPQDRRKLGWAEAVLTLSPPKPKVKA